jgi:hypothetical protein
MKKPDHLSDRANAPLRSFKKRFSFISSPLAWREKGRKQIRQNPKMSTFIFKHSVGETIYQSSFFKCENLEIFAAQ